MHLRNAKRPVVLAGHGAARGDATAALIRFCDALRVRVANTSRYLLDLSLSTMAFASPGALGVKLARPDAKVLAAMGDGAFLMNSQEIETAVREHIPLVVLIWEDGGYGLIESKMDLELGDHY